jgi:hypothetical protein
LSIKLIKRFSKPQRLWLLCRCGVHFALRAARCAVRGGPSVLRDWLRVCWVLSGFSVAGLSSHAVVVRCRCAS